MQSGNYLVGDPLSLERIRSVLTRLEDTIIFGLIERAQYAHNPRMYQPGAFKELQEHGFPGSWLDWFLKETEAFHAKARRYTSPDETPFTENLPEPVLPPLKFPEILFPNTINANPSILAFYVCHIIPRITSQATRTLAASKRAQGILGSAEFEDDGNYGSAATLDVEVLQAVSKRVHYGKFVSESKFLEKPSAFIPHILKPNRKALEDLITKPEVEKRLLERLAKKAATYSQSLDASGTGKIDISGVVDLYESYIIPLTKEVEVEYLLHRLDGLSEDDIQRLANEGSP
ncbi:chorismate mutase aro7 [Marasmius tenuissimus]|uniref:Chorismate mutase n=1 Tax=Marasmius tenuissimus TaxID=585030 RepID=A0ABR3A8F6_9AGAR